MESIILGFIFLVIGVLNVFRPSILLSIQVWIQRVIMGAEYKPSQRTYLIMRIIGVFFVLIGLLALLGILDM